MDNHFLIYGLCDPETKEIRYIGKTNNLRRRIYTHKYYGSKVEKSSNQHVLNWIHSLMSRNLEFEVIVLEKYLTESESVEREIHWIKFYQEQFELCNHNEGGLGFGFGNKIWEGRSHSEETKQKLSIAATGKSNRMEPRRKNGNPNYRSKLDRGFKPTGVMVFDADTKEKLFEFSSILECSKVLNLNRGYIKRKALSGKSYTGLLFQLEESK